MANKSSILTFLVSIIFMITILQAQPTLIPKPQKIELLKGGFTLSKITVLQSPQQLVELNDYLYDQIRELSGIVLSKNIVENSNLIILQIVPRTNEISDEAYTISVNTKQIIISASRDVGLFRGIQTLLQLIPVPTSDTKIIIPCCDISDSPRFSWRGLNLDCGRHFMTKDFIKRYIDILAHYKFNIFHWHLTEDQGWRIEIKKYPKLTSVGAWRKEVDGTVYGGFYSQEDIKEIVNYAKSRFITIVPEIEMPGHCLASLASYPENSCTGGPFEVGTQWGVMKDVYCAGNDSTFIFLQNILDEVTELFPGEYIHIGGDEVPKDGWKACSKCQLRIKEEGLKDEKELQTYFIKRISNYLAIKEKKIIGWDEILEGGLAPGATVQSWNSFNGAVEAARQKHYSISSPASHTYLNVDADNLEMRACYSFDPVPQELTREESKYVMGSEANMWTEHAPQETIDSKLFPRLLALAEVFWTNKENKNYDEFHSRITNHYERLLANGIQYGREAKTIIYKSEYDEQKKEFTISLTPGQADLTIYYTIDGSEPNINSKIYNKPVLIKSTKTLKASAAIKNHFVGSSISLAFTLHKALDSKISVMNPFSERYTAGGLNSLIDGIRGTNNFRDGQWQGYEEVDFNSTIDLGSVEEISKLTLGCLQDASSWIFLPTQVEFYISIDNINFQHVRTVINDVPQKTSDAILKDFSIGFNKTTARYIKVIAKNVKRCPAWHPGAGGKCWVFVDEIIVE